MDKTKENADLWVQFASAALTGVIYVAAPHTREQAVVTAAEVADGMLAEWHKRFGIEKDIGSPLR